MPWPELPPWQQEGGWLGGQWCPTLTRPPGPAVSQGTHPPRVHRPDDGTPSASGCQRSLDQVYQGPSLQQGERGERKLLSSGAHCNSHPQGERQGLHLRLRTLNQPTAQLRTRQQRRKGSRTTSGLDAQVTPTGTARGHGS